VRRSILAAVLLVTILVAPGGCKSGTYEPTARSGEADRGETNGRMFDLISNKPDGDDWQIRIRDSSMWAAYSGGEKDADLGTVNLDAKETAKLWKMIDDIDLGGRDKGEPDDDAGYLQLRLREPGGEEGHDVTSIYITRNTDDEAIVELGTYLQQLLLKYHKKKVDF
jgi:hypothetical protein